MKAVRTLLATMPIVVMLFGAGCVSPYSNLHPEFRQPPESAYFRRAQPAFAAKANPDPQGRKFRIDNIWIDVTCCEDFMNAEAEANSGIGCTVARNFLPLRKQARNSEAFRKMDSEDIDSMRECCICQFNMAQFEQYKNGFPGKYKFNVADPEALGFLDGYPSRGWLRRMNAELETRYPALFSRGADAFPVDVAMELVYDGRGPKRYTSLYEAWIIGLPQHASITSKDCHAGNLLKPEEGFSNPYDALAAALFKLSTHQLEELSASNPSDFDWLVLDTPISGLARRNSAAANRAHELAIRRRDLARRQFERSYNEAQNAIRRAERANDEFENALQNALQNVKEK